MNKFNVLYMPGCVILIIGFLLIGELGQLPIVFQAGIGFSCILPLFHFISFLITREKFNRELAGHNIEARFYSASGLIAIGRANTEIVATFPFNPGKIYTVPMSKVESAKIINDVVDDKTCCVAVEFIIEGSAFQVVTFSSGKHYTTLQSNEVQAAISKAGSLVEILG